MIIGSYKLNIENNLMKHIFFGFILFISCRPESIKEKQDSQTFDSSSVAYRSYFFNEQLNSGKLDTCLAKLNNDTITLTFGTDKTWLNRFEIIISKEKYFGNFLHVDDGGAYMEKDRKVIMEYLRVELNKKNYKVGDTITGWAWATSKLYHFKHIPMRDKFEGSFTAILQ